MIKYAIFIILVGFLLADEIDELEYLYSFQDQFLYIPDNLYKEDGLWYSTSDENPYTGRVEVYKNNEMISPQTQNHEKNKIAECTIVDGFKNGYYVQYYTGLLKSPGIAGLYINDKKEGTWAWFEPYEDNKNKSWYEIDDYIITTIEYYEGIKHGAITVHKTDKERIHYSNYHYPNDILMIRGQYQEGLQDGEWYFFDPILDNIELSRVYFNLQKEELNPYFWTREFLYDTNELINKKCRDNWDEKLDCGEFENRYYDKLYSVDLLDKSYIKVEDIPSGNIAFIKDRMGIEREIDVNLFLAHIGMYHKSKTNIHRQDGYSFDINDGLRNMLRELIQDNNY